MLIIASYFRQQGWSAVKDTLAYCLLSLAAFYVFGLLLMAVLVSSATVLVAHYLYKRVFVLLPKILR